MSSHPEDFGFDRCTKDDLKGGAPAENAAITTRHSVRAGEGAQAQCGAAERRAPRSTSGRQGRDHEGRRRSWPHELIDSGAALANAGAAHRGQQPPGGETHDHPRRTGRPRPTSAWRRTRRSTALHELTGAGCEGGRERRTARASYDSAHETAWSVLHLRGEKGLALQGRHRAGTFPIWTSRATTRPPVRTASRA